jgi:hypothetical protein
MQVLQHQPFIQSILLNLMQKLHVTPQNPKYTFINPPLGIVVGITLHIDFIIPMQVPSLFLASTFAWYTSNPFWHLKSHAYVFFET